MDDWYGKAVALKEDANAARTHSKLVYTAEEVFNRASNTLTSAAFYDENDYARALIGKLPCPKSQNLHFANLRG